MVGSKKPAAKRAATPEAASAAEKPAAKTRAGAAKAAAPPPKPGPLNAAREEELLARVRADVTPPKPLSKSLDIRALKAIPDQRYEAWVQRLDSALGAVNGLFKRELGVSLAITLNQHPSVMAAEWRFEAADGGLPPSSFQGALARKLVQGVLEHLGAPLALLDLAASRIPFELELENIIVDFSS